MKRREVLAGFAASALTGYQTRAANVANTYLEFKIWRLRNSPENQAQRVSQYLQNGLGPALARAGAKLIGAFSNIIAPDGPFLISLAQYSSLAAVQEVLAKITGDEAYEGEVDKLCAGPGLPFVRIESSLLRSFDAMPEPVIAPNKGNRQPRVFELRTYESQSLTTLRRKIGMFNGGEIAIFQRLGMNPVFFGETIVGPKQPNLVYMLSFDDLAARERLWHAFVSDPEWKRLSSDPKLKDAEIVANISNVIVQPLSFSQIR